MLSLGVLVAASAFATLPAGFSESDALAWREQRKASLTAPEGWLSLVGLHWLSPGTQTLGAAEGAQIRLAVGPDRWGTLRFDPQSRSVWLDDPAEGISVDGASGESAQKGSVKLRSDAQGPASVVRAGVVSFTVIERSGKVGLRVRSSEAVTRTEFKGLDYFSFDPAWVIDAKFERFAEPTMLEVGTVIGTIEPTPSPGRVHFEWQGQQFSLQPTGTEDSLFFVFADRTSGKESYGAARFLYAKVENDRVILDFNRSYNPPCAFTPFATCPLPTPENRLNVAVRAGEKKYVGSQH